MRLQSISRLVLHESRSGIASRDTSNVLLFQLHYAVHNMNRKTSGLFYGRASYSGDHTWLHQDSFDN